eukprot:3911513-Prorocentrum_lima.AAC.1
MSSNTAGVQGASTAMEGEPDDSLLIASERTEPAIPRVQFRQMRQSVLEELTRLQQTAGD